MLEGILSFKISSACLFKTMWNTTYEDNRLRELFNPGQLSQRH